MSYNVINISTTAETYIANGILTHNKLPFGGGNSDPQPHSLNVTYDSPPSYYTCDPYTISYSGVYCGVDPYATINFSPTSVVWCVGDPPIIPICITLGDTGTENSCWVVQACGSDGNFNPPCVNPILVLPVTCLDSSTNIEKFDGTSCKLENIKVGDELKTIDLNTMKFIKTRVTSKTYHLVPNLYSINNGLIKTSATHKNVIKRDGGWRVITSNQLRVGDIMLDKKLVEHRITTIQII